MKKGIVIATLLMMAISLVVPSIALAYSFGLGIGMPPTTETKPVKIVWDYGYPQYTVAYANVSVNYGFGRGWICFWGQGIQCSVKVTGDEATRVINSSLGIPEVIPSGYEPAPLQYMSINPTSWQSAPSNGFKNVWIRFNLPNTTEYRGKHYVFTATFSLLQEGGQAQICYQAVKTFYVVTQD